LTGLVWSGAGGGHAPAQALHIRLNAFQVLVGTIRIRLVQKAMKAPKIVAKGSRLNAQRIREIAQQHQVPIVENKPLARLMFKYGKVGAEIPAQLYAAVAEILAWVYRVNRYRYYTEHNHVNGQIPMPATQMNEQPAARLPS